MLFESLYPAPALSNRSRLQRWRGAILIIALITTTTLCLLSSICMDDVYDRNSPCHIRAQRFETLALIAAVSAATLIYRRLADLNDSAHVVRILTAMTAVLLGVVLEYAALFAIAQLLYSFHRFGF